MENSIGTTITGYSKRILLVAICSVVLSLSACSYGTFFIPKQQKSYGPTEPSAIAISTQNDLELAYESLGRVAVVVWGSGDQARSRLQDEAAKLGANAVIQLDLHRAFGRTSAAGLAVRVFTK